ncbi:hypothetical protein BH11BAC2_BH11BAC2_00980 [soil metagenome]
MDKEIGNVAFFLIVVTFLIVFLVLLLINLLLTGRNRKLKHQTEVLEIKASIEEEVNRVKIEVAESTLNDVAHDLHDNVGQLLTFSIIQLNNLRQNPLLSENNLVGEARDSVQEALQSIRSISKVLSHDYISSFGIKEATQRIFESLERNNVLKTQLDFQDDLEFVSSSNELFAFRIIQECVNNTIKHAEASEITLKVSLLGNEIQIIYQDNGKGSDKNLEIEKLKNGLGMTSMRKRAEMMKGTFEISPAVPHGLKILLEFPNS